MKLKAGIAGVVFVLVGASGVQALTVVNPSFETLPDGGLPLVAGCVLGCSYSNGPIPGWIVQGGDGGQFQPGNPLNNQYFNTLPDGATVAYSNGATISQIVAATAQVGVTYTLQVERGNRKDTGTPDAVALYFGATPIFGSGPNPTEGDWATYTIVHTVGLAEAGLPIKIALSANGAQGDWDNVRLTATPLPGALPLFATGLGIVGLLRRRRKREVA